MKKKSCWLLVALMVILFFSTRCFPHVQRHEPDGQRVVRR